jgi:hypothetical protein
MNDHLTEQQKKDIDDFIEDLYPEYLKDQIEFATKNLERVRKEINQSIEDFTDPISHRDGWDAYVWSKFWNLLEDNAVSELRKVQTKLKRYSIKKGYIEKPDHLFDLDQLKEVPLENFYDFQKRHDSGKGFVAICPFQEASSTTQNQTVGTASEPVALVET